MSRTAYPQAPDVVNLLTVMGQSVSTLDVQSALDDAVETWENQTGWRPFLADAVDVARNYTPQSGRYVVEDRKLVLDGGLTAAPTSVVSNTATASTTLTLNTDFWLKPDNAVIRSVPIEWLEFGRTSWPSWFDSGNIYNSGPGANITITGKWGYAAKLPPDVWWLIMAAAAATLYVPLWTAQTGGLAQIGVGAGDLTMRWDRKGAYDMTVREKWQQMVQTYHRTGVT